MFTFYWQIEGHKGHKIRARIETDQNPGAAFCGAAYQQTEFPAWLMLQGLIHLSADVKPKFWLCTPHWYLCMERGRKALHHSPSGDDTSVQGQEKSLYTKSQLKRCSHLQGSHKLNITTSDSRTHHSQQQLANGDCGDERLFASVEKH